MKQGSFCATCKCIAKVIPPTDKGSVRVYSLFRWCIIPIYQIAVGKQINTVALVDESREMYAMALSRCRQSKKTRDYSIEEHKT